LKEANGPENLPFYFFRRGKFFLAAF